MHRLFVTGGSGFIGTNLIESLLSDGIEVMNFDVRAPLNRAHMPFYARGDVRDLTVLKRTMSEFRPDFIVHLAARCDLDGDSVEDYSTNTAGVQNMVEAVRSSQGAQRVIFASSRYVHRTEHQPASDTDYSPFTAYGESKVVGEKIVRSNDLEAVWLIVRPTSIWGPWFDIPYRGFFSAVRKGLYVHPRGEKIYKSYGYVGNSVHQIRRFLESPAPLVHGKTFYLSDHQPIEVRELAELVRKAFGAPPVREVPLNWMRRLAVCGDLMRKAGMRNPPLTSFRLTNLRTRMVYDLSATERVVGELPFNLQHAVSLTAGWMQQHV